MGGQLGASQLGNPRQPPGGGRRQSGLRKGGLLSMALGEGFVGKGSGRVKPLAQFASLEQQSPKEAE